MAVDVLIVLILVMVSWVYAFVKTDQIFHCEYEQLIVTFQKNCKNILKMSLAVNHRKTSLRWLTEAGG